MIHNITARILPLTVVLSICGLANAQSHLMRQADVYGDRIVFTYEGDLWLVPAEGGDARRITNDPGIESSAKFSPDGTHIAFTAQYDGGRDVYVMDARGGVPVRLTYHPGNDGVLGWFPDGRHVLFRSNRDYPFRGQEVYKASIDGGMPERLPVDRAGLASISPDGERIAYNRITREQSSWKRHQGGTAQEIWVGSLDEGDFRPVTGWVGTDNYPMWADDAIYFTSDRKYGTLNIYRYDLASGAIEAITSYADYDVKYPSLSAARDTIIYQYGETLHVLKLRTGDVRSVPVTIPTDRVRMRPELVSVSPRTGSFSLSPTGKRMLLEARGEIINVPVEDGEPINLTATSGSREKNAAWSPDGRWIAFISDKTGEEEVHLVDQKAQKPWKQLTTGGKGFRMQPVWSPDSKWLVFSDKFLRLNLVSAESGKLTTIDQSDYDDGWERWGIQDYAWSPDSKWIAYTKLEKSGYESIFVYSLSDKTSHRITSEMTQDWSPSFDPSGQYLYFLSNRTFSPTMGFVDQNHVYLDMARPYLVLLAADAKHPFAPEDSEEEIATAEEDEKADEEDAEQKDEPTRIDLENIERRIIVADGVDAGNYFRLEATDEGFFYLSRTGRQFSKYQTVTDHTGGSLDLYHYDIEERETSQIIDGIANYHLSSDGEKLVYRSGSTYGVVEAGSEASVGDGTVDLGSIRIKVDRGAEFLQMFNEAWRIQRDWFYDPNMHGLDWKATGDKYRAFVADCGNRSDLTYLIKEMIGELNVGHSYSWGGDVAGGARRVPTGLLGVEFSSGASDRYYRIARIIPGTPGNPRERSPLDEPGCPIKAGDYLIAIDGDQITTSDNIYRCLQNKSDSIVTLTYNDKPKADGAKRWRVRTLASENAIRYREWVNQNRARVEKASGGQIGYVHIPDMGSRGLIEFAKVFFPHHYRKGFVLDVRNNGGGFTADMMVDRIERKIWGITQPREGKFLRDPERCFHGHLAVVINEDTASCGEFFATAVQLKDLAVVIGVRTWGGAFGIEPHQNLVDGGTVTPPQFGLYGLERTWLIEGTGVVPDIEVQNWPGDVLEGEDPQLATAVEYLQGRIAQDPKDIPPYPEFPDKSKK